MFKGSLHALQAAGTSLKDVRNKLSTLDAQCSAVFGKLQHRADCHRQRISIFEGEVIKAFGSRDTDMNCQVSTNSTACVDS